MAGRGSRFAEAGYTTPKPLIPLGGKPMIQWVIENVRPQRPHRFTFICLNEHLKEYPEVAETLQDLCPGCNIVKVKEVTEGAACTVLLAKEFINNSDSLMIANADQYVDLDINEYLSEMDKQQADGLIMTFEASHPKWSYCRMNNDGTVSEVVEKQVVSHEATVGIYNFRWGSDFVDAAEQMIASDFRVNNEFYVAPTYNELIKQGRKIVVKRTGGEYAGMCGLGVPVDMEYFKTTIMYKQGCSNSSQLLTGKELIAALTRIYVQFFNDRNIEGVGALLDEGMTLEDPAVKRLEGKTDVLNYIRKIFDENKDLSFEAANIYVDGTASVIEFRLHIGGQQLKGADIVQWNGRKIMELRAYL